MENIQADVLVIGGGLAGLVASLEAKSQGLDVVIVSKGIVGRSGNTLVANANIASLLASESEDRPYYYSQDILKAGRDINDRGLVQELIQYSGEITNILEKYGVSLKKINDKYLTSRIPGHSKPRVVSADARDFNYLNKGLALTLPLVEKAKKWGIKIINNTTVVRILTQDNQVCGAIALDKKSEEPLVFKVGQIILASGGGGKIFTQTNNTADMTGDSYSIAFEAGAQLRDMEFIQFFPTMMYKPIKAAVSNSLLGEGGVLRNSLGERFMSNYDSAGDMATRDVMARAIFTEIANGRGQNGSIFMDCTGISPDILLNKYQEFVQFLKKAGLDIRKDLIPVAPGAHFFMGGVKVNKQCETTLSGLFACGEAVGGLHGANRLGGNALAEAVVFGKLAGRNVKKLSKISSLPRFELINLRKGNFSLKELKLELSQTMWKYGSLVRDGELLIKARDNLKNIRELSTKANLEIGNLVEYHELQSMLVTSQLIIEGALKRKESRGAHFRLDYPLEDENYKGSLFYEKKNGTIQINFESI